MDGPHCLHHLAYHLAAFFRHLLGAGRQFVGLTGIFGILPDRTGQLLHA